MIPTGRHGRAAAVACTLAVGLSSLARYSAASPQDCSLHPPEPNAADTPGSCESLDACITALIAAAEPGPGLSTAVEMREMRARLKSQGMSEATMPKGEGCPGGRRITVSLMPEGLSETSRVWNAHADTCSDAQFQRVRAFFLGAGRGPATDRHPAQDGRLLARSEIEAIAIGIPYEEVRAKLGAPSWGECGPKDGFTAEWTYKARPHWIERRLRFGRDHRLVAKR